MRDRHEDQRGRLQSDDDAAADFHAALLWPTLPDAQSVLMIPLTVGERLIGVLAAEDRDPMRFNEWHEAYLEIIGNQIALGIGRTEFSNREMRVDASLGLPPVKDNLESRLILLRHRLQEKCPDLKIVSTGRGKFALRSDTSLELVER